MTNERLKSRILTAIKRNYSHLSQKQIKKLIADKRVLVNSRVASLHSWVMPDDEVRISGEVLRELVPNEKVDCRLLKKTEDYIFFCKGPNIHSVALDYDERNVAANWLLTIDAGLSDVSKPLESGLVHRLDYETSGVMVAARHRTAYQHLKILFDQHKVHKEYICHVANTPPQNGVYIAYAGQRSKGAKKIFIEAEDLGSSGFKKIQTEILSSRKLQNNFYELTVRLITGHRHQIRAHLAFLGCPIVGDKLYGGVSAERLMLRAERINFQIRDCKEISVKI